MTRGKVEGPWGWRQRWAGARVRGRAVRRVVKKGGKERYIGEDGRKDGGMEEEVGGAA